MTAEEYWKQKYDEQDELFGHRWEAIVKFNVDTMESWTRLQIEKHNERLISNWGGISDNGADYIRRTPITLD